MTATATGTFGERLDAAMIDSGSLLCVGLDPVVERFPAPMARLPIKEALTAFHTTVIEATHDLVCAWKPNLGFYVRYGLPGLEALYELPDLIPGSRQLILDCKVGDIDTTSEGYAGGFLDNWGFDAITVNPYIGEDGLAPFFSRPSAGLFVLCKTSNPGSKELQDLPVSTDDDTLPLHQQVARQAVEWNDRHPATIGLVVGATYPQELAAIRQLAPDLPILLPGVGAQAGDLEAAVRAGIDRNGRGLVVNSSRRVTYPKGDDYPADVRRAASSYRDAINQVLST